MAVTKLSNSGIKTGVLKYDSMLAGNAAFDPAATWLIERISPTTTPTSITFSSIPSTYQHLQLRIFARNNRAAANSRLIMRFNSDSGTNYTLHELNGNGTTVSATGSTSSSSIEIAKTPGTSADSNVFGATIIDILDYASATKNKTVRCFWGLDSNGSITGETCLSSGLWMSTSAINSIAFTSTSTSGFVTNSTFALYGIKGV